MRYQGAKDTSFATAMKILIPILIIAAGVAAVYLLKNAGDNKPQAETTTSAVTAPGVTTTAGQTGENNPDFALNADSSFDVEALKAYKLPILVEFGAEWCEPCKYMLPIVTALNEELRGRAIVKFVDTDLYWNIASQYNFEYIPTQLLINADGTPFNPPDARDRGLDLHYDNSGVLLYTTHTGTLTKKELLNMLDEMGMK